MLDYLLDLIFREYLDRQKREREPNTYYPSEIGYCLRSIYYRYVSPKDFPIATLLLFQSGVVAHEWLAKVLSEIKEVKVADGLTVKVEVISESEVIYKLLVGSDEVFIKGRFDELLLIKFVEGKSEARTMIELKTVRDLSFINEPKLHHYMQINFYMKLLNITEGYIMYLDRKNYSYKLFPVELNMKLFETLIDRAKYLHNCIKYNQLPEPEGLRSGWMCGYCNHREECYNEIVGR